jgi:hypothetical protein
MPRLWTELFFASLLASTAFGCRGTPPAPDPVRGPGAAANTGEFADRAKDRASSAASLKTATEAATPSIQALLAPPQANRWSTPGGLRWRLELGAPANAIRATQLGGLLVSAGEQIENVTSRGVARWTHVAGPGHRMFRIDELDVVWAPKFGRLFSLLARGGEGWSRRWDAGVIGGAADEPLLMDAATVAAVGEAGEDKWRVVIDGLRKLSEPFLCDGGMLFQGSRGLAGVAVTVSARGTVVREMELERGAVVVGASSGCEPLVWNGAEIGLLDARGLYRWRRVYAALPFVERLGRMFLLASGAPERPVRVESVSEDGDTAWTADLPTSGRFSRFGALDGALDGGIIAGLCLNAESACSSQDGDRGPYNTLLRVSGAGAADVLERQLQGHLGVASLRSGGFAAASSSDERSTEVSFRDATGAMRATVTLPGRLTAGPFVGADGEVYAATCDGWRCAAPYSLFAITGIAAPEEVAQ